MAPRAVERARVIRSSCIVTAGVHTGCCAERAAWPEKRTSSTSQRFPSQRHCALRPDKCRGRMQAEINQVNKTAHGIKSRLEALDSANKKALTQPVRHAARAPLGFEVLGLCPEIDSCQPTRRR